MDNQKIIEEKILSKYTLGNSISDKMRGLITQQKKDWELVTKNYAALNYVERKIIGFNPSRIIIQFNPGRLVSSSADVDSKSIEQRPCFLCADNLPPQQKGLLYKEEYLLLVNPFPIFNEHFTVPLLNHQPQRIDSAFMDMLDLSRDLSKFYTVFYNGPSCGASAPDHMHFQVCSKNIMPVEKDLTTVLKNEENVLFNGPHIMVRGIENYLRYLFIIESKSKSLALIHFDIIKQAIKEEVNTTSEPMLNIIALYDYSWKIIVFPRARHRPTQYFHKGKDRMLISPAAVDFGGLFITPRKEDFEKISINDIKDIFSQTSVSQRTYKNIAENYLRFTELL